MSPPRHHRLLEQSIIIRNIYIVNIRTKMISSIIYANQSFIMMPEPTCPGSDILDDRCSFSNFLSSKPNELEKSVNCLLIVPAK